HARTRRWWWLQAELDIRRPCDERLDDHRDRRARQLAGEIEPARRNLHARRAGRERDRRRQRRVADQLAAVPDPPAHGGEHALRGWTLRQLDPDRALGLLPAQVEQYALDTAALALGPRLDRGGELRHVRRAPRRRQQQRIDPAHHLEERRRIPRDRAIDL